MASPRAPARLTIYSPAFVLAFLANFCFFSNASSFFLLPLYIKSRQGTAAAIGAIMGMYSGASILMQPPMGVAINRWGRKPLMAVGASLAALVAGVFALLPPMGPLLYVLRFLQGAAYAFFFVANYTFIADTAPRERRGEALGIFGLSGIVSGAVAPAVGELIIHRAGFTPFFLFAAGLAVMALLMLGILPDTPRPKAEGAARGVLRLLAQPRLTTALIATLVFGANMAAVFTFVPTFSQSVGIERIGLFYLTYTTAAVLVRVFGGRLSDIAGRRRVILPGLLLLALGTLLLAGVASLTGLALVGVLNGIAHGMLYPALSAYIIDAVAPADRGRAVGVFSASFLLGHMSGSFGFGALVEASGYPTMFVTAAGLTTVGLLVTLLAREGHATRPGGTPNSGL